MIQAERLLNAINRRIANWELIDTFYTMTEAKLQAGISYSQTTKELKTVFQGTKVKQYDTHRFVVLGWQKKGENND